MVDFGSLQSIVASSAQNDSGLFEVNLRDERYLPFENSGAISEWQLELPADPSQGDPAHFDYDTISDVILHIRYTAREGGELLRKGAIAKFKELLTEAQAVGSVRLFSIRHEFPTEWARFQNQTPGDNQRATLALNLQEEHYPFWSRGRLDRVERVDLLARSSKDQVAVFDQVNNQPATKPDILAKDAALGNLLVGKLENIALPTNPVGDFKIFFDLDDKKAIEELWVAIIWGSK